MSPENVAILVAFITTLGGGWSYLAQRRTLKENRELQKQQAEAQAFTRAREHYESIINELTDHVTWLKGELSERTNENDRLRDRIVALEKIIDALKAASVIVIEPSGGDRP